MRRKYPKPQSQKLDVVARSDGLTTDPDDDNGTDRSRLRPDTFSTQQ